MPSFRQPLRRRLGSDSEHSMREILLRRAPGMRNRPCRMEILDSAIRSLAPKTARTDSATRSLRPSPALHCPHHRRLPRPTFPSLHRRPPYSQISFRRHRLRAQDATRYHPPHYHRPASPRLSIPSIPLPLRRPLLQSKSPPLSSQERPYRRYPDDRS